MARWPPAPSGPPPFQHCWAGFSTGVWEGNMLTITTTHLKPSYIRRNGIPRSDKATITEHWTRHGSFLTVIVFIDDPVFLTEPLIRSENWALDPGQEFLPQSCEPAPEIPAPKGTVPQHLPGTNPFLHEVADWYGLPVKATRGGAETMLPEFRQTMGKAEKVPEKCDRYCTCGMDGTAAAICGIRIRMIFKLSLFTCLIAGALAAQFRRGAASSSRPPRASAANGGHLYDQRRSGVQHHRSSRFAKAYSWSQDTGLAPLADKADGRRSRQAVESPHPLHHQYASMHPRSRRWQRDLYQADPAQSRAAACSSSPRRNVLNSRHDRAGDRQHDAALSDRPAHRMNTICHSKICITNNEAIIVYHVSPTPTPTATACGPFPRLRSSSPAGHRPSFSRPTAIRSSTWKRSSGSVQGEIAALNFILDLAVPADKQEGGTLIIPGRIAGHLCEEAEVVEYRDTGDRHCEGPHPGTCSRRA